MKQGTTQSIKITLDCDISNIDSVIFTIKQKDDMSADILLQKFYPQDTEIIDGVIYLGFTQEETALFNDYIYFEGQINFYDKSVAKTQTVRKLITDTLYTEIIEGNKPLSGVADEITLSVGEVAIIHGADGKDGIDGKDGAQGIQGEKGINGINGKDYILTTQDKQEIADIVGVSSASKIDLEIATTSLQGQIDTINVELVGVSTLQQANLDIIGGAG